MCKVLVKNIETNIQRIAQVVALDPPESYKQTSDDKVSTKNSPHTMLAFPTYHIPQDDSMSIDQEVAYLSPLLAFNLDLHISCLKYLLHQGQETLASLFKAKVDDEACEQVSGASSINLGLETVNQTPRYAAHLRISFVKIPECGTLESLKGSSSIEAEDRQELIDLALHKYFEVDRYLARSDIFSILINWNCKSIFCIPCSQRLQNRAGNIIYFKVRSIFISLLAPEVPGSHFKIIHVFRLLLWNHQMKQFFESIVPKLPLCLEEVLNLLFPRTY